MQAYKCGPDSHWLLYSTTVIGLGCDCIATRLSLVLLLISLIENASLLILSILKSNLHFHFLINAQLEFML